VRPERTVQRGRGLPCHDSQMRVLVLGGTAWVGHQIAATAISRGHEVTCLARGSAVPEGARLMNADRDDADALQVLAGSSWDVVFDVARQPGHVRRAVRNLEPLADRYIFVSTGNVYAAQDAVGADETAELNPPLKADRFDDPDDYGPAKVACENAVLNAFGPDRTLIARAGLIGGPGDPTHRTDYWPWRFAHPAVEGHVLVPDARELPTAVIDVRDLADWLVRCAEASTTGIFNALGSRVTFPEHIAAAKKAAGSDAEAVMAPESWLQAHDVSEWSGDRSLPLWLADRTWYGMNARSLVRAQTAGLELRPLVETLRDSLRSRETRPPGAHVAGLSDGDERELLRQLLG
jgi:2'-hydroxyisoflavone reductase